MVDNIREIKIKEDVYSKLTTSTCKDYNLEIINGLIDNLDCMVTNAVVATDKIHEFVEDGEQYIMNCIKEDYNFFNFFSVNVDTIIGEIISMDSEGICTVTLREDMEIFPSENICLIPRATFKISEDGSILIDNLICFDVFWGDDINNSI